MTLKVNDVVAQPGKRCRDTWQISPRKELANGKHVYPPKKFHPAILEKMYIKASDGLMGPKVEYIELYGKDPQTGGKRYQKIVPK
jgi:hypothetical protein